MTADLALLQIFDSVKQRFEDEGSSAKVVFGWRERTKQSNQGPTRAHRVVFEPGVEGKAGSYAAMRRPGRNPRPLRTHMETCTVYCWGYDATAANEERAQYAAAKHLHDAVVRAIELAMRGECANLTPEPFADPEWILNKTERVFGAELKFTLTVEASIVDSPLLEQTDVQAGIGTFLNDEQDSTDLISGEAP